MSDAIGETSCFVEDKNLTENSPLSRKVLDLILPRAVISPAGLEHIAGHKYKSGAWTHLDNILNPAWTAAAECLPLWLAPNTVTTLGFLHCLSSYTLLWRYQALETVTVGEGEVLPSWVLVFSAYCAFAYYTLDCMDGKQARRTGQSSPLGQLFDHGVDCISLLSHFSNVFSFVLIGGSKWFLVCQVTTHIVFFSAQWVEYHTGSLPTGAGKFLGVTEVNYGVAILTFCNAFINREAFWLRPLAEVVPETFLPPFLLDVRINEFCVIMWAVMNVGCIAKALQMVFHDVTAPAARRAALAHLTSPLLLAAAPFALPAGFIEGNSRYLSLSVGLLFSHITTKLIVFGMARMSYANVQREVLPFCVACIAAGATGGSFESVWRITPRTFLTIACWLHGLWLVGFCRAVIIQICARLDIYCFSIKKKKD